MKGWRNLRNKIGGRRSINNVENPSYCPGDMSTSFLTKAVNMFPGSEKAGGRKMSHISGGAWGLNINAECVIRSTSKIG